MYTFWLGRVWSEFADKLEVLRKPYQLIVYKPYRARFKLDQIYRVVAIHDTSTQLVITIAAEQEALI